MKHLVIDIVDNYDKYSNAVRIHLAYIISEQFARGYEDFLEDFCRNAPLDHHKLTALCIKMLHFQKITELLRYEFTAHNTTFEDKSYDFNCPLTQDKATAFIARVLEDSALQTARKIDSFATDHKILTVKVWHFMHDAEKYQELNAENIYLRQNDPNLQETEKK